MKLPNAAKKKTRAYRLVVALSDDELRMLKELAGTTAGGMAAAVRDCIELVYEADATAKVWREELAVLKKTKTKEHARSTIVAAGLTEQHSCVKCGALLAAWSRKASSGWSCVKCRVIGTHVADFAEVKNGS